MSVCVCLVNVGYCVMRDPFFLPEEQAIDSHSLGSTHNTITLQGVVNVNNKKAALVFYKWENGCCF